MVLLTEPHACNMLLLFWAGRRWVCIRIKDVAVHIHNEDACITFMEIHAPWKSKQLLLVVCFVHLISVLVSSCTAWCRSSPGRTTDHFGGRPPRLGPLGRWHHGGSESAVDSRLVGRGRSQGCAFQSFHGYSEFGFWQPINWGQNCHVAATNSAQAPRHFPTWTQALKPLLPSESHGS